MRRYLQERVAVAALLTFLPGAVLADEAPAERPSGEDLVRETQNPVSSLFSLPFQNNFNFGVGPGRDLQNVPNIQPVLPMTLAKGWNLIHRFIVPVIAQPELVTGQGGAFGVGDLQTSSICLPTTARASSGSAPDFDFGDCDRHPTG